MTIERGKTWGERGVPPADLPVAHDDAAAAALAQAGRCEFHLEGGDLWRTLGGSPPWSKGEGTKVVLDLMQVSYHQGGVEHRRCAVAHVVIRLARPKGRGLRRRRPTTFVMNAQYLGLWDLVPRGHPNDGRLDIVTIAGDLPWRQRLQIRRRLPTGTHLPHPGITTTSFTGTWHEEGGGRLTIDGQDVGEADRIQVAVVADSVRVWI